MTIGSIIFNNANKAFRGINQGIHNSKAFEYFSKYNSNKIGKIFQTEGLNLNKFERRGLNEFTQNYTASCIGKILNGGEKAYSEINKFTPGVDDIFSHFFQYLKKLSQFLPDGNLTQVVKQSHSKKVKGIELGNFFVEHLSKNKKAIDILKKYFPDPTLYNPGLNLYKV